MDPPNGVPAPLNGVPAAPNGVPAAPNPLNGVPAAPLNGVPAAPNPLNGVPAALNPPNGVPAPPNGVPAPPSPTMLELDAILGGILNMLYNDENFQAAVNACRLGMWQEAIAFCQAVLENPLMAQHPNDPKVYLTGFVMCYSLIRRGFASFDANDLVTALQSFGNCAELATIHSVMVEAFGNPHNLKKKLWIFSAKSNFNIWLILAHFRLQEVARLQTEIVERARELGDVRYSMKNDTVFPFPQHFRCALTRRAFMDPVMTPYGFNYERQAILEHLRGGNHFDPHLNLWGGPPLQEEQLSPNTALQAAVHAFMETYPWAHQFVYEAEAEAEG